MKRILVLLIISSLLYSCNKKITGSWRNPQPMADGYDSIFIAALTINLHAKKTLEHSLANHLQEKGITTLKSSNIFPPNFTDDHNDKDYIFRKIRRIRSEAILTVSIIDIESDKNPSFININSEPLMPDSCYDKFWDYYTYLYPLVYKPRYYSPEKIYYIETRLYDTQTEQLIWSARSKTYVPHKLADFSKEFAQFIIAKLEKDNVIKWKKSKEETYSRSSRKRRQPVVLTSR